METPQEEPAVPRIGLVLSCGGARGLAHVGVIQVLEEARIPIAAIMGSSMGAYVGSLWAAGVDGKGLFELASEIKDRRTLLRLIDPILPPTTGLIRGDRVRRHIERNLRDLKIKDLHPATYICATNLDTVTGEMLDGDTPVGLAVQASCAIPGVCAPVRVNGHPYVDGGAAQPLPVNMLRRTTTLDSVIAVTVMPTPSDVASCGLQTYPPFPAVPGPPKSVLQKAWWAIARHVNLFAHGNVMDTFKRSLNSAQLHLIAEESRQADVVIHPFCCESRWYDFHNFNRYIESGREAAVAALPQIQALLKRSSPKPPAHEIPSANAELGRRAS
jgi:NTE family protein